MKVVIVDPWNFTPPYDAELCNGLTTLGHEVTFVGMAEEGDQGSATRSAIVKLGCYSAPAAWLPRALGLLAKGILHILGMIRLHAILRNRPPDVIHFQWLPLPLIDALFVIWLRRIAPVILTVHDSNPYNGAGPWLLRAGSQVAIRSCDRLIVHNQLSEQRLKERGVPRERIYRVAHGLLGADQSNPNITIHPGHRPLRFLQFGKIKEYKGTDVLLAALALLDQEHRDQCQVSIVGQPYIETAPLVALVERHRLRDTVDLRFGFVSNDDMKVLFSESDFLIFPYRDIDTSGVLMAAIARAIPIVASDIGCFSEMLTRGEGLLVPPDDPKALAEALVALIENPPIRLTMRARMEELRERIPSWIEIAEKTTLVYRDAETLPESNTVGARP